MAHTYGPMNIYPNSNAHLGDIYNVNTNDPDPRLAFREFLHYDGMGDKAWQLSLPVIPLQSFDWVWSSPFKEWLRQTSKRSCPCFWITGKPGSGKSTLMKYLVDAPEVREILSKTTENPIIVHFFFDYRAGSSTANNEIGILKSFISQLCIRFPYIEEELVRQSTYEHLTDKNLDRLMDLLKNAMKSTYNKIYAFIDGLDEYEGNHTELASFLLRIQSQLGMKICFASRPEASFQRLFCEFPSLVMQKYNEASIRVYIDHAINSAHDRLLNPMIVFDKSVREEIIQRSQGVIIWSRLAIDAIFHEAYSDASHEHITSILEDLPDGLEQMYDRTFARIQQHLKSEAALLLLFLNEFDGTFELHRLYGLWHFFYMEVVGRLPTDEVQDEMTFLTRLQHLLGSFMDITYISMTDSLISKWFTSSSSRTPWQIRLLHKTLQPFVRDSRQISSWIPVEARAMYPDNVRARIFAHIIVVATANESFDLSAIRTMITSSKHNRAKDWWLLAKGRRYEVLKRLIRNETWNNRLSILFQSIIWLPSQMRKLDYNGTVSAYQMWQKALKSPLMLLELCQFSQLFLESELQTVCNIYLDYHDCIDLRLAVEWGLGEYVQATISHASAPSATACTRIFALAVDRLWSSQRSIPLSAQQKMLNCLKSRCDAISIRTLLLRPEFTTVGLSGPSNLVEKARIVYEVLSSIQHLPIKSDEQLQETQCTCQRRDHLLHDWLRFQSIQAYRNVLEPQVYEQAQRLCNTLSAQSRLLDTFEKLRLRICWTNDGGVNKICQQHGSLFHILIDLREARHSDSPWQMVKLCILLAKMKVDPMISHNGKTPAQKLEYVRMRRLTECAFSLTFTELSTVKSLNVIQEILKYYEVNHSWPDFAPLTKKYGLIGLAKWEFDEYGGVVLDREAAGGIGSQPISNYSAANYNSSTLEKIQPSLSSFEANRIHRSGSVNPGAVIRETPLPESIGAQEALSNSSAALPSKAPNVGLLELKGDESCWYEGLEMYGIQCENCSV